MNKNDRYHVFIRNNDWVVKKEGASEAAGFYETKSAAASASIKKGYDKAKCDIGGCVLDIIYF